MSQDPFYILIYIHSLIILPAFNAEPNMLLLVFTTLKKKNLALVKTFRESIFHA